MFKPILTLTFALCCTTQSYGQTTEQTLEQKIDSLSEIVAVQQAQIAQLNLNHFAVGSVKQSFLTLDEFQAEMGSDWVLCDGTDAPADSQYTLLQIGSKRGLGSDSKLPNCAGNFLRSVGGYSASLAKAQSDATAVNSLKNSSSSVSMAKSQFNHDHGNTFASRGIHVNHFDKFGVTYPAGTHGLYGFNKDAERAGYSEKLYIYYKNFTGYASGRAAAQSLSSSDLETRPQNITVNTFIKIN